MTYADWKERVAAIFSRLHNEPIEKWREHMAACGEDCWREMYDDGLTPSNTVNEELRNAG